jgi:hypothetical protein
LFQRGKGSVKVQGDAIGNASNLVLFLDAVLLCQLDEQLLGVPVSKVEARGF